MGLWPVRVPLTVGDMQVHVQYVPHPDGQVEVELHLPGLPVPWGVLTPAAHWQWAQDPRAAAAAMQAATHRAIEQAVTAAMQAEADTREGWPFPLTDGPGLDALDVWALLRLDAWGEPFSTSWMTCGCGHVRQRLRRDAAGYVAQSETLPPDLLDLAEQCLSEEMEEDDEESQAWLSGLAGELMDRAVAGGALPEVGMHFEVRAASFHEVAARLEADFVELHAQATGRVEEIREAMAALAPEVLDGPVVARPPAPSPESGGGERILWVKGARPQPRLVVQVGGRADVLDLLMDILMDERPSLTPLVAADVSAAWGRALAEDLHWSAFLAGAAHVLAGEAAGEELRWLAQARSAHGQVRDAWALLLDGMRWRAGKRAGPAALGGLMDALLEVVPPGALDGPDAAARVGAAVLGQLGTQGLRLVEFHLPDGSVCCELVTAVDVEALIVQRELL